MAKLTIYISLTCLVLLTSFNQHSYKFDTVYIEKGGLQSIRLTNEGLICKAVNMNLKQSIRFFKMSKLDHYKLLTIELKVNQFMTLELPDLIDDSKIETSSSPIQLKIINQKNFKEITWIDGENKDLDEMIKLVNNLIPEKYRDFYSIK